MTIRIIAASFEGPEAVEAAHSLLGITRQGLGLELARKGPEPVLLPPPKQGSVPPATDSGKAS